MITTLCTHAIQSLYNQWNSFQTGYIRDGQRTCAHASVERRRFGVFDLSFIYFTGLRPDLYSINYNVYRLNY